MHNYHIFLLLSLLFAIPLQEAPCATPLLAACNENRIDVASFLISKGANINYRNTVNVIGFGEILCKGSARDSRNARFAQCAFLVAQVKICQNSNFVITLYMSNNHSNRCRCLRRLVVQYKGEISLYFDPSSRHSCRT